MVHAETVAVLVLMEVGGGGVGVDDVTAGVEPAAGVDAGVGAAVDATAGVGAGPVGMIPA